MKDFTFNNQFMTFETYNETCAKAQKSGYNPIKEPPEVYIEEVQDMIDIAVPVELISRWMEDTEESARMITGVFLYDADEQEEQADKVSYAVTITPNIDDDEAIIGVSKQLLDKGGADDFAKLVLLHEMAHAASTTMEHNEEFTTKNNLRVENYLRWDTIAEVTEDDSGDYHGDGKEYTRTRAARTW